MRIGNALEQLSQVSDQRENQLGLVELTFLDPNLEHQPGKWGEDSLRISQVQCRRGTNWPILVGLCVCVERWRAWNKVVIATEEPAYSGPPETVPHPKRAEK